MSRMHRMICWMMAALLSFTPVMTAQAAFSGTGTLVEDSAGTEQVAQLLQQLQSQQVQEQLRAFGVSPEAVQARIQRMTDQELQQLGSSIGEWDAGGDALGLVAAIFLVFVITDALGITDVFPFVRPVR